MSVCIEILLCVSQSVDKISEQESTRLCTYVFNVILFFVADIKVIQLLICVPRSFLSLE